MNKLVVRNEGYCVKNATNTKYVEKMERRDGKYKLGPAGYSIGSVIKKEETAAEVMGSETAKNVVSSCFYPPIYFTCESVDVKKTEAGKQSIASEVPLACAYCIDWSNSE